MNGCVRLLRSHRPIGTSVFHCAQSRASSSSGRWLDRNESDFYRRQAQVQGLRSRAAFKLLQVSSNINSLTSQIDEDYHIFKSGQTVVDLGYAPGSWSQVAVARTSPGGRVLGVDIIPEPPPPGASSIQGNFLATSTQDLVKVWLSDPNRGRTSESIHDKSYIDMEREYDRESRETVTEEMPVDVILSDLLAPWPQVDGFWKKSLTNAYFRMANTSGIAVRDHGTSMDLCDGVLLFAVDVLKPGGSLICKFYQGSEDHEMQKRFSKVFSHVKRGKPEASRNESKEGYFIATKKKPNVTRQNIARDLS